MSEQLPDIGKMGWQELADTVKQVIHENEMEMGMARIRITDQWDFVTMKSSVLDRFDAVKSEWESKNKRKTIPYADFLEILLDSYTQDFTSEAQRLAASNGEN